jgi:hypothetical protein
MESSLSAQAARGQTRINFWDFGESELYHATEERKHVWLVLMPFESCEIDNVLTHTPLDRALVPHIATADCVAHGGQVRFLNEYN